MSNKYKTHSRGWVSDIWRTSWEKALSDQLPSKYIGLELIPSQISLFSEELISEMYLSCTPTGSSSHWPILPAFWLCQILLFQYSNSSLPSRPSPFQLDPGLAFPPPPWQTSCVFSSWRDRNSTDEVFPSQYLRCSQAIDRRDCLSFYLTKTWFTGGGVGCWCWCWCWC